MIHRLTMLITITLTLQLSSGALRAQEFELIAHWEFEDGVSFLSDSSGNGHHLQGYQMSGFNPPTFAADKPAAAAGGGSAIFNGTSSFAQTASTLNLAPYDWVRFSYWMKVETTQQNLILFENSFDSNFQVNTGSTMHIINPSGLPDATALIAHRTGIGFPSQATTLDLGFYDALDEWHFVQVDYNFSEPVPDERIKITINGEEGSTFRSIADHDWAHLRDDFLFFGGRQNFDGIPTSLFVGKIDEVKIEGIDLSIDPDGDFNLDTFVDAADYVAWRKFDTTEGGYEAWVTNFGSTIGGASSPNALNAAAAPEPSSLALTSLVIAVTTIAHGRRRKSREFK
jgi:hypothetical protein